MRIFLGLSLALLSLYVSAQKIQGDGIVLGKIVDQTTKKPLEYAKIKLFKAQDNSLAFGQYTDVEGKFNMEGLPLVPLYMVVSFSGYDSLRLNDILPTKELRIVNLGELSLLVNNQRVVDEVVVQGKQDILKSGIDKKVYNVAQDLTLRGGTANDVLKNLPSIDLDQDGRILLRGEGSVNILIDGKPSSLTGSNGKTLLDALPAGSIERIEIVTNPSAKYDPDGSSGIINIVLKKNKLKGFNGLVSSNLGSAYLNGGNVADENVSLSYRNAAFNSFVSYNARYLDGYRNNFMNSRQTQLNDTLNVLNQRRTGTDLNAGQTFRMGFDVTLKHNRSISFTSTGSLGRRDRTGDLWNYRQLQDLHGNSVPTKIWRRESYDPSNQKNLELSLNFRQNFKSNRGFLTVDATHSMGQDAIKGFYNQSYYSLDTNLLSSVSPLLQRLRNNEFLRVTTLQTDGVYLWPDISLRTEFGAKGIVRHQVVDTYSETMDSVNLLYHEDTLSNFLYNYDEQIFSVYGIVAHQFNKLKYQAGIRLEQAYQIPNLISDSTRIVNHYVNFFPSAHVRYVLKPGAELGVSYSRRITRAASSDLNPFTSYADPLNLQRGNPYLQPEYIDSYDFSFSYDVKKLSFSASLFYRHTTDMISRIRVVNANNFSVQTFINLNTSHSTGTEFVVSYKPNSWLRSTFSTNVNYIQYVTPTSNWNRFGFNGNAKLNASADFWKRTATVQLNVNYISPRITILGTAQRRGAIDVALDKRLGEHWTVGCKVTDVLNRQGFYAYLRQPTIEQDISFKWLTRRFYVNVSYKFGKLEMTKPKTGQEGNPSDM
ncbi:MAG: TonB-dependent receptor [Flavobacteriia bacterium]|nr:TonB-dependent receptor [Flavobacteriia bacterium]